MALLAWVVWVISNMPPHRTHAPHGSMCVVETTLKPCPLSNACDEFTFALVQLCWRLVVLCVCVYTSLFVSPLFMTTCWACLVQDFVRIDSPCIVYGHVSPSMWCCMAIFLIAFLLASLIIPIFR